MSSRLHSSQGDWNAHWDYYAESARLNPAQRMRHDLIARLLCETAADSTARVFDLDSGQGDLLQRLQPLLPKAKFLGVDFAGWATHAVSSEVLEHVDDPGSFLKHARKYLAPGARLIVTVPGGPMSAFDRHIGHRQHFDRRKIRAVPEEAGYAVERIYLTGFPFFNLYRLLVIARGNRLAQDAETQSSGISSGLVHWVTKLFGLLFRLNLRDSPFGWQVVAVAGNTSP